MKTVVCIRCGKSFQAAYDLSLLRQHSTCPECLENNVEAWLEYHDPLCECGHRLSVHRCAVCTGEPDGLGCEFPRFAPTRSALGAV
jgi:hypothetical protein